MDPTFSFVNLFFFYSFSSNSLFLFLLSSSRELFLGWLLVSFFTLMIGLSLAEICSAFPTTGGLYFWTTRLASADWVPLASWVVGYTNWLGLVRNSFFFIEKNEGRTDDGDSDRDRDTCEPRHGSSSRKNPANHFSTRFIMTRTSMDEQCGKQTPLSPWCLSPTLD